MKKFEKELLFSQVEGETTTGSGNGTTGENAGEGENDAPEQEPVDEGAEDDNNMYDGGIIDPVEVVAYPTDPADTPSDAEGPEEEEDESYYGDDSDVNDNSAPDNEYEYGDDGEGDGNTNEDDTQSSTEQSDEEKTEENPTQQPSENERVVVEDGWCVLGTIASVIQKALNISATDALQMATNIMESRRINPNPEIFGNPGIKPLSDNVMLSILNSIANINAGLINTQNLTNIDNIRLCDQRLRAFFNDNEGNEAIINVGRKINETTTCYHLMHAEKYLGNLYFIVYDPVEGESSVFRYEPEVFCVLTVYGIQYNN